MSHYECKKCWQRYDDCQCKYQAPATPAPLFEHPKDISGNELKEGDEVAFCLAGKSHAMKIGEVVAVLRKTVRIEYMGRPSRYSREDSAVTVLRSFDSVCKVWR